MAGRVGRFPADSEWFDPGGAENLVAIEVVVNDRDTEGRLSRSEELFDSLFEGAPHAIVLAEADSGLVLDANRAAALLLGIARDELVGMEQTAFHAEESRARLLNAFEAARALENSGATFEETIERTDGERVPVEIQVQSVFLHGKDVFYTTYRDISIRKHTQEALRSSKEFLQAVIDAASDSIMVIDTHFRVQLMNATARRTSRDVEVGAGPILCHVVSHGSGEVCSGREHPCPLQLVIKTKRPLTVVHQHLKSDGSVIPFELTASPLLDDDGSVKGIIEVGRDISERIELEEARRRRQERRLLDEKDRSLVTIAGGMAHDFNNLLTTVIGNTELLRMRVEAGGKDDQLLAQVMGSAEKMAELTRQLLAYAKRGRYQPEILHGNKIVTEALEICRRTQNHFAEPEIALEKDAWTIFADRQQMHQMLVNLFRNAFEALEGTDGKMSLAVRNVTREEAWQCFHGHAHRAGDYVCIEVRDTGPGIAAMHVKRIFEPFYTTHFFGRGLGLSAALGIVQNHGGCISVESEEDAGTVFTVYLPRVEEQETRKESTGAGGEKDRVLPGILVVDDDEGVLALLREILQQHGYRAVCVPSGREALQEWKKDPERFSLVILDVQLQDMDGKAVFREIKATNARMKVLLSSGFDEQTAVGDLQLSTEDGFLQKPFNTERAIAWVRELIGPG